MDFITPILNIIWPLIKKLWPYIIISALVAVIWLLHNRKEHFKAESRRNEANTNNLLLPPSAQVQLVELTKTQIKQNKAIKHAFDSLALELKTKPKNVREIHQIRGETIIHHTTKIDTIVIEDKKSLTAEYESECLTAKVILSDSAQWDIKQKIALDIVATRDKPKRWFWRGLWNKNKWGVSIDIVTPCDSVTFSKNIKLTKQ